MFCIIVILANCRPAVISPASTIHHLSQSVIVDDGNVRRMHVSTRPHNHKVVYHKDGGYWYVFYGHGDKDSDGKHRTSWRTSKDGNQWSERHTAFEGNSHSSSVDVLLTDKKIAVLFFRPHYYREKAGIPEVRDGKEWFDRPDEDFYLPYEIQQYDIKDGDLIPGSVYPVMHGTAFHGRPHYGSLTMDTSGYFWVGARAMSAPGEPYQAWVVRSSKANDISAWESDTVLLKNSKEGSMTVQVVALDEGKVYAVIFSQSDAKIYGSLYDPRNGTWETPFAISEGNSQSKRAVAAFDSMGRKLHLVYIDNAGALRHKTLLYPYRKQDWVPNAGNKTPGIMIVPDVVTERRADNNISLSIDNSKSPAHLIAAYHKKTPHYYMRWFDGVQWQKEEYPIGIHNRSRNADEISMIRDYSEELGLLYYVYHDLHHNGELHFLQIPKKYFQDNNN